MCLIYLKNPPSRQTFDLKTPPSLSHLDIAIPNVFPSHVQPGSVIQFQFLLTFVSILRLLIFRLADNGTKNISKHKTFFTFTLYPPKQTRLSSGLLNLIEIERRNLLKIQEIQENAEKMLSFS